MTHNAFVFVRSELLHPIGILYRSCYDQLRRGEYPTINQSVIGGITTLCYGTEQTTVSVYCGILNAQAFDLLYPTLPFEMSLHLRKRTIGLPFLVISFDLGAEDPYLELANWKGKFSSNEHPNGTGIRREIRALYSHLLPSENGITPGNGGNFLHTPDSADETFKFLNYLADNYLKEDKEFSYIG